MAALVAKLFDQSNLSPQQGWPKVTETTGLDGPVETLLGSIWFVNDLRIHIAGDELESLPALVRDGIVFASV